MHMQKYSNTRRDFHAPKHECEQIVYLCIGP